MHPELFRIPFLNIPVQGYGTFMVIGFLVSVFLMRRMVKRFGQNPETVANLAMYVLISGIVASRIFYVLHHHEHFTDNPLKVFAVWQGGLEFLGGVIGAGGFLAFYFWRQKLPKLRYLDVLAVGLMIGAGFGRLGCMMRGCCYGKTCDAPWAVTFPYQSPAFESQVYPDPARHRLEPQLELPDSYFQDGMLKPFEQLTPEQQQAVTQHGPYHTLPVHPTQIYDSLSNFAIAGFLYLLWRRLSQRKPGIVLSTAMVLYGISRFFMETLRDDNPFEHAWWLVYRGGTISQNLSLYMVFAGVVLLAFFITRKPQPLPAAANKTTKKANPRKQGTAS
jgi:phosphatidylglycerol---prolipoprotein diacylglyceryl transferase